MFPWDFVGNVVTGLFGLGGQQAKANAERQAAKEATASQERIAQEQLQYQREAGLLGFEGGIEEQRRRQQEAAFRAGKLEDVVGMLQGLQGPQFQAVTPGTVSAGMVSAPGAITGPTISAERVGAPTDVAGMRAIAGELQAPGGAADLRAAAQREIEMGSEQLAAAMAAQGLRGSGYAGAQTRAMAGDIMANLARDISAQRMQGLTSAAGVLGQAGGLEAQTALANQAAALEAAGLTGQLGMQGQIATGEMGLDAARLNQQAQLQAALANQTAALQAAGMNQDQAQAMAQFQLAQATGIGNIYSDEAFGANAPLDLARQEALLEEYRRRWGMGSAAGAAAGGTMGAAVMPGAAPRMGAAVMPGAGLGSAANMLAGGMGGAMGGYNFSPAVLQGASALTNTGMGMMDALQAASAYSSNALQPGMLTDAQMRALSGAGGGARI